MPRPSANSADLPDQIDIVEPLCAVFRRKLKADGLKYTPERAHVLDAVVRLDGIFDAEQVVDALKDAESRVSKATIYRTLRLLQDAGIVQRVMFTQDQPRYQLVYGSRPTDVLVRLDTGEVTEIEIPGLDEAVADICKRRNLRLAGRRVQIFAEPR